MHYPYAMDMRLAPADNQSIRLLFILTEQHNFSFLSDHVVHPTLPAQSAPQSHINQPPRLAATPDQHTSSVLQKVWLPSHGNQDIITQSSFLPLPGPKSDCNHTKVCTHAVTPQKEAHARPGSIDWDTIRLRPRSTTEYAASCFKSM
jgi:hypothetical protein